MTIRNLLPVLILPFLGAGFYSSTRLFAPPASAATSQDQHETNQVGDDAQNAAAKFSLRKRLPEGGKEIPVERYLEAREQMRRMPRYSTARNQYLSAAEAETDQTANWTELGPGNIGGRTRALIIHPTNHDTMYAAAASGGVWKTTDGGASWKPLADVIANIAVNALAIDRSDPNVIYAGTGEGFFNFDAIRGAGIFKSADGGATWAAESGIPHVVTEALALNRAANATQIFAFTYGRGAHRAALGGADCLYSLSPASATIKAEGGAGSVNISAPNGCPWMASVNPSGEGWIRINGADSGGGGGTINFTVEPNTSAMARAGTINIAGRSFTITQTGIVNPRPPALKITSPTSAGNFSTDVSTIRLSGTAVGAADLTQVTWRVDRGFINPSPSPASGIANGTANWSIPAIILQPGVNFITVTAYDTTGASGSATINVLYTASLTIVPIAGNGASSYNGDNRPALTASFSNVQSLAVDNAGTIYVLDAGYGLIHKINPFTGIITKIAGGGTNGVAEGIPATDARLQGPTAIALDVAGNIYITEFEKPRVRKITTDRIIRTIAGTGESGYGGDGGPAIEARFRTPWDVKVDGAGNVYIADLGNNRVRKIDAATGIITTMAGGGSGSGGDGGPATTAQLSSPMGIAFDSKGNLHIADNLAHTIRKVAAGSGIITTVAGAVDNPGFDGDGSLATAAKLRAPSRIACDRSDNLYVYDRGNGRIRKINAGDGIIVIVANYRNVTSVHAASFTGPRLSSELIAAAFGVNLAAATETASALPLPTILGGSSVRVRDSEGRERSASLFFVSPLQINYQIPPETAGGPAATIVTNSEGVTSTGSIRIEPTAPGLFSANADGQGVAAALALRVRADGSQSYEPVAVFDQARKKFIALPLDFGAATDRLFLILFGTGLRQRASLSSVSARIGDEPVEVLYAGAQGGFVGLDQINLSLPRTLAGRGEVDVVITTDDNPANTLRVAFAGAACNYRITSNNQTGNQTVPAAGGAFNVGVATGDGCYWSARSSVNWITSTLNGYASGNGTANFGVEPNTSPLPRTGQVRVAGQNIAITQSGAGDSPPPSLTVNTPGGGAFTVSAPTVGLSGSATGEPSVAFVNWSNDRGGYGLASGADSWSIAAIPLQVGENRLTITVYDSLGRSGSSMITVNFRPEFLIQTIAGTGSIGVAGDGGPSVLAQLGGLFDVAFDSAGNIVICDQFRIRKLTPYPAPPAMQAGRASTNLNGR